MKTTLEDQVRADFIIGLKKDILKAILDACNTHGPDPKTQCMITASFDLAIRDLDSAFPRSKYVIQELLKL